MRDKYLAMLISVLAFLPKIVFADIITPLSLVTIPLIPGIVLVEFIVFWIARKINKFDAKLYLLFVAVFVANVTTSFMGTIFPLYKSAVQNTMFVGIAFILSVLVEWGIYELFFRKKINVLNLFLISLIGNMLTYAFVLVVLFG